MLLRLPVCLAFFLVLLALAAATTHAQTPPITYQRYDTTLAVQMDGTVRVREIQQIRFDGEFHSAFAEIPTDLTTEIRDIQIYEADLPYAVGIGAPNTFITEPSTNAIYVSWEYTPTVPGDVRTFVLEYTVVGGLWVYPDEVVLEWRAVPADRSGVVVASSTVTVTLPMTVTTEQLKSTAYGPDVQTATRSTGVTFTASEPLPDGVNFQVQVGWPAGLIAAEPQPWQIVEEKARLDYQFKHLTVELALDADGTLSVDEYHHLTVKQGALDQGYRRISLQRIDALDQIALVEGAQAFTETLAACPYCLQVIQTPSFADWVRYDPTSRRVITDETQLGSVQLDWQFPPLVRGEETTLHLRYRVQGVVRHLPDQQLLKWTAVFPGRGATIDSAQVKLRLPRHVAANQVKVTGGQVTWQADGTALITAARAFYPEQAWEIALTLPVTATHGAKPRWQEQAEAAARQAIEAEIQHARVQLGFGMAALFILLLGGAGVYLLWFLWGRDRPLPPIADYLTEPPSSLPPAIVAYLIDEAPSVKGALASLVHLANLGLLRLRFDQLVALKRVGQRELTANAPIQLPTGETLTMPRHLVTLFNALLPALPDQQEAPLHQIYTRFQAVLPRVYAEMGDETNRYFEEAPTQARHRWLVRGQWIVLLGVIAALILAWVYWQDLGWLAVAPALAAIGAGLALIMASQWMPRRTAQGVEEKQRWLAFGNYLRNLQQYGSVNQAQRILDRYFAYAVALGVEELVLEQAAELGGSLPDWSYTSTWEPSHRSPTPTERPQTEPRRDPTPVTPAPTAGEIPTPSAPEQPPIAKPGGQRPTLSGLSRQLSKALTETSHSLGDLLSTAVRDVNPPTPFASLWQGTQAAGQLGADVASTTFEILGEILESAASGEGGSGGYGSSSSSRSSWSSSSSRSSSSSSSSSSSGRDSSSRRSGGGGRRGFG